jgi:nucleoside phosphorylase
VDNVDILIITALKTELDAAKEAQNGVTTWREHTDDGPDPYLSGGLDTPDGGRLTVALARPTRMGGRSTSPVTTALTEKLKPTVLAMSGVCAGNPADTAPGDVLIAAPAFEHDEGKHKGPLFQGDFEQYPQDERWLRAAQDFDPEHLSSYGRATEEEAVVWLLERLHKGQDPRLHPARKRYFPRGAWPLWLEKMEADTLIVREPGGLALADDGRKRIERAIYDDVDGPEKLPFAVFAGPMASGSAVIENPAIWENLKNMGNRKILGVEMEAATIATVAHSRKVPHWLVAKGVMDNAVDKDDRFKEFAARASAEVLFALLATLVTPKATGAATERPQPRPVGKPADRAEKKVHYPGSVKLDIIQRLHYDWQDLADLFGVPTFARATFAPGREPRELWEWLEVRGRLGELPDALDGIHRPELAALLREQSE